MSASKGLSITVRLSWGQLLPTHDIKPSPPKPPAPSKPRCFQGSESLGVWHWGDGSYQPGASNWQGSGDPQRHTPWSVSQDLASFSHFPTICRPVGLQWGLEVIPGGGGVRVALASQCSFQTSCEIPGF